MVQKQSIQKNLMMNIVRLLINMIFPLITFPYASRILLPDGIGKISFAQSYITYFMLFAMLGIPTYGIRVCAQVRESKEELSKKSKEIFLINLLMTSIVYIIYFLITFSWNRTSNDLGLYLILGITIILNTIGVEWVFQALEKYSYITMISLIFKLIGLILLFVFVRSKQDYIKYAAIMVFSGYFSNLLNYLYAQKYIWLNTKTDFKEMKKHLKPILILFAISAAASIYLNLDTLMLGIMTNDIEVGYYSTSIKIKNIVLNFITALGTVMLPRTSYYLANNMKKEYKLSLEKSFDYVKIISISLMVLAIIYSSECIYILAGSNYKDARSSMIAIMPVLVFSGFSNIIGMQVFVSNKKERYVLIAAIIGAVIDLVLNLILIPKYLALGASIATTITEFIVLLIEIIIINKDKDLFSYKIHIKYNKCLISIFVSTAIVITFKYLNNLNTFIDVIVGSVLFIFSYFLILFLLKEEIIILYFNKYKDDFRKIFFKEKKNGEI